ncbi:MAG: type II 3-dehydroquinate dehydratase [Rikenellaceae bacterium]
MPRKRILIVNGPNLNLLGKREQSIYGDTPFDEFLGELSHQYIEEAKIECVQSNVEGELINFLHNAVGKFDAVVLNGGGYTHTSVALADAVGAVASMGLPTVEVHISNILSREEFRHISLLSPRCVGSIMGFGMDSYRLAIDYITYEK